MQVKGNKIFCTQQKYGNTSRLPALRLFNSKESFKNIIGLKILKNYSFKISSKKTSRKMHTFFNLASFDNHYEVVIK
jgi:hypothetical protein